MKPGVFLIQGSGVLRFPTILKNMFMLPVIGLVVALVMMFVRSSRRRNREIETRWRHWTTARDWLFHPQWPQLVRRFRGGPFGRGSSRRAYWGFEGSFNSVPVIGFHYRYTVSSGENSTTYTHLILALRITHARFPPLELSQRGWGRRGVTFENTHFNKLWQVTSASDRFAHDFFNPRTLEIFLQPHPPFEKLWIEGDHLLLQLDHRTPMEEVDARLILLTRMLSYQPDFLFREVGAEPPELTKDGPGVTLEEQRRRIWGMQQRELQPKR